MILGSQTIKCHVPPGCTFSKCIMRYADRLISLGALTLNTDGLVASVTCPPVRPHPPSINRSIDWNYATKGKNAVWTRLPWWTPNLFHFTNLSFVIASVAKQVWKIKTLLHIGACFFTGLEWDLSQCRSNALCRSLVLSSLGVTARELRNHVN